MDGKKMALDMMLVVCLVTMAAAAENELQQFEGMESYCQWEAFNAKCADDEAILINRAFYGRMAYGRCVKRDYGYVGCYTDVRTLADMRCSGRPQCTINVPDKLFDATIPCPDDLKMYLLANYSCVKVVVPSVSKCSHAHHAPLTALTGYLSSYVTNQTGCGSATIAPWRITLGAGQRINLTLVDFSAQTLIKENISEYGVGHCRVFAIIRDLTRTQSKTVCGLQPGTGRVHHILVTEGAEAEVRIMATSASFLIKYEAVGCADVDPGQGGWFKRQPNDDNKAEIGCIQEGKKWPLICEGHIWTGHRYNCSRPATAEVNGSHSRMMPNSSAFLLVIGIAVVIGVCILAIGLLIIKRQRYLQQPSHQRVPVMTDAPQSDKSKNVVYMSDQPGSPYTHHHPYRAGQDQEENEYAYVEDYQSIALDGQSNTYASGSCPQHPGTLDNSVPGGRKPNEMYNSLEGTNYRRNEKPREGSVHRYSENAGLGRCPSSSYHMLDTNGNNPNDGCV